MPDLPLPDAERTRRQQAVDFARTSIELSGLTLSPDMEALNARFIAGEISSAEHSAAILAHTDTLPQPTLMQEYFASLEELEADKAKRSDG